MGSAQWFGAVYILGRFWLVGKTFGCLRMVSGGLEWFLVVSGGFLC